MFTRSLFIRSFYLCGLAMAVSSLAISCSPSVPDGPTWAGDVAPILAANCVRCHTVPAIGGAPDSFRLDTYEDWVADDGRIIRGAGTMASYVRARIQPQEDAIPRMPPAEGFAELTSRQADVVANWAPVAAAEGLPARGAPRDGNRGPEMTILSQEEVAGTLVIDYEIRDPDRDIVVGELRAGQSADGAQVITRELHSGRGRVTWDTGAFANGSYQLFAVLSDTSESHPPIELLDQPYTVSNGNVAPTVTVANVRRDSLIARAETPDFDILVNIVDPDTADLTLSIKAVLGDQEISVASYIAATAGDNTVTWPLASVTQGDAWHLEVTVEDGANSRTVEVGPFIIGTETTTETFATITNDVLAIYCNFCHPGAMIPGLTHDFALYQGTGDVLGITELRGLIYRRAVQQGNMPPLSSSPDAARRPPAAALDRLENWLLAGAPEGVTQ
ncbi:MAG: hypothetical protein MJE77_21295 [Proteobacteria bacterium]|nr:hypothetical protein [Pseudomonadota bacterium]